MSVVALFPRVYRSILSRDVVNETQGGNCIRVGYMGVESFALSGRGHISSTPCNNKVNVLVNPRPVCSYCGDLCNTNRRGPRLVCVSPRNGALARREMGRLTLASQVILLYNRCRNISREVLSRVISRRVSVNSCILANNRLPTLILTSDVSHVLRGILPGSRTGRLRDRCGKLLRCPRCAEPCR